MKALPQARTDALKTLADMQKQGRMSHAERMVIERAFDAAADKPAAAPKRARTKKS